MGGRGPWAVYERRVARIDTLLRFALHHASAPAGVAAHLVALRERGVIASDEELVEELRILLLVGHETMTAAIAWMVLTLARHPPTRGDLDDDRLVEAVVQEALRLHPPVVDVVRELAAPMRIGADLVPAGTVLMALPPLVHRRADLYDEPELFRPQRFVERRPDPMTWIPFGGRRRRCLGATLALLELKAVVKALAGVRELRLADGAAERPRLNGTTLVPNRGGRVVLGS